jgi:hypothetical protein
MKILIMDEKRILPENFRHHYREYSAVKRGYEKPEENHCLITERDFQREGIGINKNGELCCRKAALILPRRSKMFSEFIR